MDRTDAKPLERQESAERAHEALEREEGVRRLARRLLAAGTDLPVLCRAFLEGLVELLGFERGFLLVSAKGDGDGGESGEGDGDRLPFRVLAARARRRREPAGRDGEFEDVANPEFALNLTVARRALESLQAFHIPDALARSEGSEPHRSVLCQPFPSAPGAAGAVYLDRGLGSAPVREVDLFTLADISERCLPILVRGILYQEVLDLRREGPAARPAATRESEEEAAAPPVEGVEVFRGMAARSEAMRRIFRIIEKIADSDLNVCIFGESGAGKELVARSIHATSRRRTGQFVSENCGTIAETLLESELFGHQKGSFTGADEDRQGLFEAASGGTLFLDEIGDMSEGMQRKLLRVLQEGVVRPIGSKGSLKVDTRVICASNRDLQGLVKGGKFRVDLYYRVNVVSIVVPPLRERLEDVPCLVEQFLEEMRLEDGAERRVSDSAMKLFREHSWPGNVRELRNVIRRAAVTCERRMISRKDVAPLLAGGATAGFDGPGLQRAEAEIVLRIPRRESFNEIIGECERVVLLSALKECRWNKSRVVKTLKIPRQSLYNMIAKHDLRRRWDGEG